MAESDALHAALVLVKDPVSVRKLHRAELPGGIPAVLAIAIGDEAALTEAQAYTGRTPAALSEAAGFFVEQVLLDRDADSYRVLGGSRRSTHEELRHNMALLMRWLHPDLQALRNRAAADREVFSSRVTRAWEDLKNDERRRSYDRLHPPAAGGAARKSARKSTRAPANGAMAKPRRPAQAAQPMSRRLRRPEGGSFWMRLFELFRRNP